jgi:hypothetical protein
MMFVDPYREVVEGHRRLEAFQACSPVERSDVIDLAAMRQKLRPPVPGSLAATLKQIDDLF